MVDIGGKADSHRVAVAEGRIRMTDEALEALQRGNLEKGDALGTARVAGVMAAKRTSDLVPLCHPLSLTHIDVKLTPAADDPAVHCEVTAATNGSTGVEMEALTAVQVALLTVYDMCKAMDRGMCIEGVRLTHKVGGRSGEWNR